MTLVYASPRRQKLGPNAKKKFKATKVASQRQRQSAKSARFSVGGRARRNNREQTRVITREPGTERPDFLIKTTAGKSGRPCLGLGFSKALFFPWLSRWKPRIYTAFIPGAHAVSASPHTDFVLSLTVAFPVALTMNH